MSKRAEKDLARLQGTAPVKAKNEETYKFVRAHCKVEQDPSQKLVWNVLMKAPDQSLYKGAVYRLSVKFEPSYPFKCPEIKFTDTVLHPNVEKSSGNICQDMIGGGVNWSPTQSVATLLEKLLQSFVQPSLDAPIERSLAELFKKDPKKYAQMIQAHIAKDLNNTF
mmetsp:Transcript_24420/g.35704  ORF Transcript_24420/g.35704 Transcript_24420/m.35704 type:complete len:166 (+) Transcript_24420:109-606(+)